MGYRRFIGGLYAYRRAIGGLSAGDRWEVGVPCADHERAMGGIQAGYMAKMLNH